MRYRILSGVAAAAFGLAAIGAWALPASAQIARFQPALANGADGSDLLSLVRERGGGGGGSGGGGGGRADGGGGGGARFVPMDRSGGGGRLVDRGGDRGRELGSRDRRELGSRSVDRSDSSRITRIVRDRDGKRRRVIVHRHHIHPFWGWGGGFALGYGAVSYAGYCMSQFQYYDPVSGLYLGYDGLWYSCP